MNIFELFPQFSDLQDLARQNQTRVYLVGGFLRDYCLQRPNSDLDFTLDKNALAFAQAFSQKVKGAWVLLDEDHGCSRVVKKIKGRICTYDFADFRAESLECDLGLRDFTINTLAVDIQGIDSSGVLDNLLIDRHGALRDIEKGRIRRVSVRSLRDDPLRILRAFSYKASLDFRIQLSTLNQIRQEKEALRTVSMERIREELFKILESSRTAATFVDMDKHGVLAEVMPQLRVMDDCPQGGYHHLAVWQHSLETVRQLEKIFSEKMDSQCADYLDETIGGSHSRRALMKLAALLHDIGKPDTRKKEGDRYSFHGHEHVGAGITRIIARQLKLSVKESHAVEDMVRWHLRPGYLSNFKRPSEKAWFRYLRDTKTEGASIGLLALADQRSTRGPLTLPEDQRHHESICREIVRRYFEKKNQKPRVPLINGKDLIEVLKLTPSPLFTKILLKVEEEQSLGKVTSHEDALRLAQKLSELEESRG